VPAISSKISHVAGFRLATLASTQPHAVLNTNLQKRVYTTAYSQSARFVCRSFAVVVIPSHSLLPQNCRNH